MPRPTVKKTAVKNARGIRRITRTYDDGRTIDRYEACVTVDGALVSLGQFPTLAEARAAQTTAKASTQSGSFVRPSAGKATFLSVAEDWLSGTRVAQAKPRTRESYASIVHGRHLRTLHAVPVNKLDHRALNRHVAKLTELGLKPATVRHVANVMKYVLGEAVDQGLLAVNPMAKRSIALPKRATVQPYPLQAPEVARLVAHLRTVSHRWATLVLFAAYTGARAGEVQGLRVSDLNLVKRSVRIERAAQLLDGSWQVVRPKSDAGVRTAENPPRELVQALSVLIASMAPSDYVFGTPATDDRPSHPYSHSNFMRRVFDPACVVVGLPTGRTKGGVGLHDLRHYYASMCIGAGMTPIEVAHRLGHADQTLVLRTYAHLWKTDDDRWADVFDNVLAASSAPSNVVPLRVANERLRVIQRVYSEWAADQRTAPDSA